jgi:hypothetical protein
MTRRCIFSLVLLGGTLALPHTASAQNPRRSVRLLLGVVEKIDNQNGLLYGSFSVDLKTHIGRYPISFYSEGAASLGSGGTNGGSPPTSQRREQLLQTLENFAGTGVATTWQSPHSCGSQVGLGLGIYTTHSPSYIYVDSRQRIGLGGRAFLRLGSRGAFFTEIAYINPITRRLALGEIGFGVRF